MTKHVLLSLAACCFFVLSPIRAASAGEPTDAVRDAWADGFIDCGPGSDGSVWRIGDVTARVTCQDSAGGIFASASLCLSSGGQALSCVRVYPGPCRIVRGLVGGIPFYRAESSPASGSERRALSPVFPDGKVMLVFDELKAPHGSPVSLGDEVRGSGGSTPPFPRIPSSQRAEPDRVPGFFSSPVQRMRPSGRPAITVICQRNWIPPQRKPWHNRLLGGRKRSSPRAWSASVSFPLPPPAQPLPLKKRLACAVPAC